MLKRYVRKQAARRGAVAVLVGLLLVFLLGMVAFAVDVGWIALVKNQLQVAADAAAHGGVSELGYGQTQARTRAKNIAAVNIAGGQTDWVTLSDEDVVFGNWNSTTRTFNSGTTPANAVKVTARRTLPLFFAPVLGITSTEVSAEAIATVNPRDIAFVIDLSGSMNNDTEIWATNAINNAFPGFPTIGSDLLTAVFQDFGYGSFPGVAKHLGQSPGQGAGLSPGGYLPSGQLNDNAYNYLANTHLLNNAAYSTAYRVASGDSASARKTKAYRWIIDFQLKQLMPDAKPVVNSSANFGYWSDYLDYVIKPVSSLPPNMSAPLRITSGANPYADAWPTLSSSTASQFNNKLGYQSYVQFMMDMGRNVKVAGSSTHPPLSQYSADCPLRPDTNAASAGYGFSFPPREQPTHATRVAVMAAIKRIEELNVGISGTLRDHVAVISFDTASGVTIRHPLEQLDCDYYAAKGSCRLMQAVGDNVNSTASENGLIAARNHIDPVTNPTGARPFANRVVIFLSDGIPNIKQSSSGTIGSFLSGNAGEWFGTGSYVDERNAVLMQAKQMEQKGWKVFVVGIGLGADRDMMDRAARMAGTAVTDPNNPDGPKVSPYAAGNPADYQQRLTSIFDEIVSSRSVSIVN